MSLRKKVIRRLRLAERMMALALPGDATVRDWMREAEVLRLLLYGSPEAK